MKSKIKSIKAHEILDSRRNPTIEVELATNDSVFFASVPSGSSRGKYEAKEMRDKNGGVSKAIKNIEEIIGPKIIGKDPTEQKKIDRLMIKLDGTKNKSKLGANAILAVSMAVCRAGTDSKNVPLWKYISQWNENRSRSIGMPMPCFNLIEGGVHAKNKLAFQEFMVCPKTKSFKQNLEIGIKIYNQLRKDIKKKYGKIVYGDEGGFAPLLNDAPEALDFLLSCAKKANCEKKINIILDIAATQLYKKGKYKVNNGFFNRKELLGYYSELLKNYPIVGFEDPFAESDYQAFQEIAKKLGRKISIIGDDLLATNPRIIRQAQKKKACNACIIKLNQIGTVSEAAEAVKLAKSFGWKTMVSHRSGETMDDFIADFAVGIRADFIKSGAPFPKERMAKYRRLAEIQKEIS